MTEINIFEEVNSDYFAEIFGDSSLSSKRQNVNQELASYSYLALKMILLISVPILVLFVVLAIVVMICRKKYPEKYMPVRKNFKNVKYHKINKNYNKDVESASNIQRDCVICIEEDIDIEDFKSSVEIFPESEQTAKGETSEPMRSYYCGVNYGKNNEKAAEDNQNQSDNQNEIAIVLSDDNDSECFESSCELFSSKHNARKAFNKSAEGNLKDVIYHKDDRNAAEMFQNVSNIKKEVGTPVGNESDSEYFESSCEPHSLEQNRKSELNKSDKMELPSIGVDSFKSNKKVAEAFQNLPNNQKEIATFLEDDNDSKRFQSSGVGISSEQNKRNEFKKSSKSNFDVNCHKILKKSTEHAEGLSDFQKQRQNKSLECVQSSSVSWPTFKQNWLREEHKRCRSDVNDLSCQKINKMSKNQTESLSKNFGHAKSLHDMKLGLKRNEQHQSSKQIGSDYNSQKYHKISKDCTKHSVSLLNIQEKSLNNNLNYAKSASEVMHAPMQNRNGKSSTSVRNYFKDSTYHTIKRNHARHTESSSNIPKISMIQLEHNNNNFSHFKIPFETLPVSERNDPPVIQTLRTWTEIEKLSKNRSSSILDIDTNSNSRISQNNITVKNYPLRYQQTFLPPDNQTEIKEISTDRSSSTLDSDVNSHSRTFKEDINTFEEEKIKTLKKLRISYDLDEEGGIPMIGSENDTFRRRADDWLRINYEQNNEDIHRFSDSIVNYGKKNNSSSASSSSEISFYSLKQ